MKSPELSPYWKWDEAIPPSMCDMILEQFRAAVPHAGRVDGDGEEGRLDPKIRKNDNVILPLNHWLEGILFNHARYANMQAGWNFDVNSCEAVQVARYRKGDFYKWHNDDSPLSRRFENGLRKLTALVLLNEPGKDYEGGGFLMEGIEHDLLPKKGDLIVFPSFINHTAVEVSSGERFSAVTWLSGPAFR